MSSGNSPTWWRRKLGRRVRAMREGAGLTLEAAAAALDFSSSKLARLEAGVQGIDVHWVRSMMDLYDQRDDELVEMARRSKQKGWWHKHGFNDQGYVGLETEAVLVHCFYAALVPGLLQTDEYARAVFKGSHVRRSEEWINSQVTVRAHRQRRLHDAAKPLRLNAVTTDSALRQCIGDAHVLRRQMQRLLELAALPSVEFRILPAAAGMHDGLNGPFTMLHFAEPEDGAVVYAEHALGAIHTDKPSEVHACRVKFEHLRTIALSPADSTAVVGEVMNAL
ncbi:helix-turn-helix protein [Saccharopolyspora erythraea NRRL 2338]|nr:helix-turn-helix transcriptional regulator [Saccharopolyspora erythraea]PFG99027.1 helix-turn-helix protein [Saccharopolyspora erythraea NRRL 2338]QRK88993.1 helix-turn-helix domain-containing protein [Saccharopolyspora erythraea]